MQQVHRHRNVQYFQENRCGEISPFDAQVPSQGKKEKQHPSAEKKTQKIQLHGMDRGPGQAARDFDGTE
jgi:hypothetical protein